MDTILTWIAEQTGSTHARRGQRLQSLWGGYGELWRVELHGAPAHEPQTAILKWVRPPAKPHESAIAHRRKCRSYEVELEFYRRYAGRTTSTCRVARRLASRTTGGEFWLLLEDLDESGFAGRRRSLAFHELEACLAWLANFHAIFLGERPRGLWKTGTYWHLATRPEELANVTDVRMKANAPEWDRALTATRFQTLVHGDAKPANFCFGARGREVAAVDFQYVGGGCGMKDVAYLLHGEREERRAMDAYFTHLRHARGARSSGDDLDALEHEWRALYPIAKLDFERFLAGWT